MFTQNKFKDSAFFNTKLTKPFLEYFQTNWDKQQRIREAKNIGASFGFVVTKLR